MTGDSGHIKLTRAIDTNGSTTDIRDGVYGCPYQPQLVARLIQGKIQLQYIDSGLAEDSPLPTFGMGVHQFKQSGFINFPNLSDAFDLIFGRRDADVRVETAAGCGYQVHRHRRVIAGIGVFQGLNASRDSIR